MVAVSIRCLSSRAIAVGLRHVMYVAASFVGLHKHAAIRWRYNVYITVSLSCRF